MTIIERAGELIGIARSVWGHARSTRRDDAFDPDFYQACYPDLRKIESRFALRQHYRRHGQAEGRFPLLETARRHFHSIYGPAPEDFDANIYRQSNPDLQKAI